MINVDWITPLDGWILQQMAEHTAKRAPDDIRIAITNKPTGTADVEHYGLYHLMREHRVPSSAYFTHQEPEGHPLHQRWHDVSNIVDICVTSADLYADMLPKGKTRVILPGVDKQFKPRKLRVGSAFQLAHGNEYRKGWDLLQRLKDEHSDWIDLRLTLGDVNDMVAWYQDLDVYLVASRYEGVPMPALEAAACGIPIVSPNVGLVCTAIRGKVYEYRVGDYWDMLDTLVCNFGFDRTEMQLQMGSFSWDRWADQHFEIFRKLAS